MLLAMLALLAPGAAVAQEQCLFQTVKASPSELGKVERSLLCLTNVHRLRAGVQPLPRDTRLGAAARAHSADMALRDYFDHLTPEGLGPSDRALAAGYPGGAGENIAANSTGSALSLFEQWRGSSGHNQNMLGGSYRAAGFGIADRLPGSSGGVTGTQMFGLAAANSNDTALDLYASSPGCAKAKLRKLKAKGKKKRRAARRKVKRLCAAPFA